MEDFFCSMPIQKVTNMLSLNMYRQNHDNAVIFNCISSMNSFENVLN